MIAMTLNDNTVTLLLLCSCDTILYSGGTQKLSEKQDAVRMQFSRFLVIEYIDVTIFYSIVY